jgi:hypothetical protein
LAAATSNFLTLDGVTWLFIDRDPELFKIILGYLRVRGSGDADDIFASVGTLEKKRSLAREMKYYLLDPPAGVDPELDISAVEYRQFAVENEISLELLRLVVTKKVVAEKGYETLFFPVGYTPEDELDHLEFEQFEDQYPEHFRNSMQVKTIVPDELSDFLVHADLNYVSIFFQAVMNVTVQLSASKPVVVGEKSLFEYSLRPKIGSFSSAKDSKYQMKFDGVMLFFCDGPRHNAEYEASVRRGQAPPSDIM